MGFFLGTPEHNHVISNHLPLIGLAASLIPLFVGVILRNLAVVRTGLLLAVVFGATTGFVMGTGEEAAERFEAGEVPHIEVTASDLAILERHDDDAHLAGKVTYGATAVAGLGLLLSFLKRPWTVGAGIASLLVNAVTVALLAIAAKSGGQIRHPEFRPAVEEVRTGDHGESYESEHEEHESDHDDS